ncbi:unnamed protein product [Bursaphelenchus xylophilus]|uniref:(pine wood nematode) hypothetical protein n=1 Tax=Bursaphelenchus xylophilus TaxID=6326 RepID=A0A1I7S871_BURXY|nr:unnamed protein product [Bursaphelenchus xylophilus]CAG9080498.1 unnamed protein product [Bursaphelenchus xylophilus]
MSVALVSREIRPPKVYKFDVDITSFTLKNFRIGTHQQELEVSISLNNPDIVILDSLCKRTYGDCPRYCDHPTLCKIYCNPICCTSTSLRLRQCNRFSGQYKHKSTRFQVLREFWKSYADDSVGVYARDVMFLTANNGDVLKLEHQTFALSVVISLVNLIAQDIFVPMYILGLGRTADKESFVEQLYYNNHIPLPVVTLTYDGMAPGTHQFVFGEYHNDYCGEWSRFDLVSETEWMIDAEGVAFFDYQYQGRFRIAISESPILRMPRHVLQSFIDRGLLVVKSGYEIRYYVKLDPTQNFDYGRNQVALPHVKNAFRDKYKSGMENILGRTVICAFEPLNLARPALSAPERCPRTIALCILCVFLDNNRGCGGACLLSDSTFG